MDSCSFCDIISGRTPGAIYFEDQQTLVLKDRRPVNTFHYLAIPKCHIPSEQDLTRKHVKLVKKLIHNGKRVMSQMGADMEDILYGFHRQPYTTINHLHLHFVSPKTNLYFDEHLYQFKTRYFISASNVLERLGEKRIKNNPESRRVVQEQQEPRRVVQVQQEEQEEEQINCCGVQ